CPHRRRPWRASTARWPADAGPLPLCTVPARRGRRRGALRRSCRFGSYGDSLQVSHRIDVFVAASGADPNQLIRDGWTPLQHAAYRGRTAMARMLLDAGALPSRMGLAADSAIAMA